MDSTTGVDASQDGTPAVPNLSTLSAAKERLLDQRLRRAAGRSSVIPRRPPDAPAVMSDLQRGIYFLTRAAPELTAYNVAQAFRLRGPLDLPALSAAVTDLVARHDALRTRFLPSEDGHVEIAAPAPVGCSHVIDVGNLDSFVRTEVRRGFDLASGCLLRATVGEMGQDDHVLVLTTHHIVSDAASKRVLLEELAALYAAHREHRSSPLQEPARQYSDYAAWQARSATVEDDLQWWRTRLDGAPPETPLPVDRLPARASWDGAKYTHHLDDETTRALQSFARANRATVFMVLVAALAGLLERYSGQGDIVIGSPTNGRHQPELESVVGLFLNTLPLRIDTSGSPCFRELVSRVRTTAAEAYRHQSVPFERIVQALRPARDGGRNPIFQAVLTVREDGGSPLQLAALDVEPLGYEGGWSKFDLSVVASHSARGMSVLWQYGTALFDAATIRRLADQFTQLLRAGINAPDVPLTALGLPTAADRGAIAGWNDTAVSLPGGCLHERIAAQAARTPDAPAVGDESGWITYRELDARANRLANHLVALGVRPDDRVAICLERAIDLEVAVLGVLKAGGAYVPLDPEYPGDRLAFMLEDSAAVALLTTADLQELLPSHPSTVLVDDDPWGGTPDTAPATAVRPDHLAYVIYTSGTTGRPKGVAVEHRSVLNNLDWMQRCFGLGPADTVLQKTPFSFDVAGWELLWTPMTGARLFMARPGGHRDPRYLADTIARQRVTLVNFVPSMLSAFLAAEQATDCTSLRAVICAGEALPDEAKDACLAALPGAELHNLYGPTEAAITVSGERCLPGVPVTIGRPAANTRLLVLDSAGNEQPIGVPGELCVAGIQVARGYLDRPELTAERFVQRAGERLYRTGDLAAWQPDGRIRFLGRRDDQVKIRGFRIELAEVAAVLRALPGITEAGVLARDGELVGFVVPHDPARWDPAALRRSMRAVAPAHLVPTTLYAVETLARLPNGKPDQAALASLAGVPVAERVVDPPRGPAEELVAELWQSLLGVPVVSADDDFFDLGGDSLSASRFVAQLRAMDVELPLMSVFTHPTVRGLAEPVTRLLLEGLETGNVG